MAEAHDLSRWQMAFVPKGVSKWRRGTPVEASTNALYGDDVKVLGTGVVGAVHDCGHRETEGHPEFVACSSTTSYTCANRL